VELEAGMAGNDPRLYRRMPDEIAEYAGSADESGYAGFGHPEHHLRIEGFETSSEPTLMGMWLALHSRKLRVIMCGFVSTTHSPLHPPGVPRPRPEPRVARDLRGEGDSELRVREAGSVARGRLMTRRAHRTRRAGRRAPDHLTCNHTEG